jgi:hypothetical protein
MTKRWIGLLPCALIACALALSCGSSDGGGAGGSSGTGGNAAAGASAEGGTHAGGGASGTQGNAGAVGTAGVAGAESAGTGGMGSTGVAGAGAAGAESAGAGGAAGDDSLLSPAVVPDLAFWFDGNAQSFSDLDANFPTPPDSGLVRTLPETPPLTGTWTAPSPDQRPIRALGALNFRPVRPAGSTTTTGYTVTDTAGTIQTDNSTLAISFCPLNSNTGQGGLTGQIGTSSQAMGIFFSGQAVGLYFNHGPVVALTRKFERGTHVTMIVRFTATNIDVQYDVNGFRSSESVSLTTTPIAHESASKFTVGYDSASNSDIYGFVSQVVGVNRAISDSEESGLMSWLTAQPIPPAFPVTEPLVALIGDSIANGDQVSGPQSWAFTMLGDLANTYPDVQLLNDAVNGGGIPMVKNSSYSEDILPWYSASRAKNVLIVAAGTNDLVSVANGGSILSDVLDGYYGLLASARATGWKTVACTVLPRSDFTTPTAQSNFDNARAAFNADVVANYATYADALADVAAIPGMGAAGNSASLTYYAQDKIHPNAAGHALLEPIYRAAVASLLQ